MSLHYRSRFSLVYLLISSSLLLFRLIFHMFYLDTLLFKPPWINVSNYDLLFHLQWPSLLHVFLLFFLFHFFIKCFEASIHSYSNMLCHAMEIMSSCFSFFSHYFFFLFLLTSKSSFISFGNISINSLSLISWPF